MKNNQTASRLSHAPRRGSAPFYILHSPFYIRPQAVLLLLSFYILHFSFFIGGCASIRAQVPPANSIEVKQRNAAGDEWEFVSLTPQPDSALTFGTDRKPGTTTLATFARSSDLTLLNSTVGTLQTQVTTNTGKITTAETNITALQTSLAGKEATGLAASLLTAHTAAANPHTQYAPATSLADYATTTALAAATTALTTALDAKQPASPALSKITESAGLPLWNGAAWPAGPATADNPWTTTGTNIHRATGNVGIGTTTPSYPLHVTGDINLTGEIRKNGAVWSPAASGASSAFAAAYNGNGDVKLPLASGVYSIVTASDLYVTLPSLANLPAGTDFVEITLVFKDGGNGANINASDKISGSLVDADNWNALCFSAHETDTFNAPACIRLVGAKNSGWFITGFVAYFW